MVGIITSKKIVGGLAAVVFLAGVQAAPFLINEAQFSAVPQNLRLKTSTSNILAYKIYDEYSEYDKDTGIPIETSKKQVVFYAYKTDVEVLPKTNEIVSLRTPNTYTQFNGKNEKGQDTFVQTSVAGQKYIKDAAIGKWFYVEYATTTLDVFSLEARRLGYVANVAWADNTGFLAGGTYASWNTAADSGGHCPNGGSWANPSNANADDGVNAVWSSASFSGCLAAYNFGFSVSGTIDGVIGEIQGSGTGISVTTLYAYLIVGGGTAGTNKSDSHTWTASVDTVDYGGVADTWGNSLTSMIVNSSDFGWAFAGTKASGGSISADYMFLKVYYTPSATVPSSATTRDKSVIIRDSGMIIR